MLEFLLGTEPPPSDALPLHTSDLPALTPSSSWSSFLSQFKSSDSLSKTLPEVHQAKGDGIKTVSNDGNANDSKDAPTDDESLVMMGPPKGNRILFCKGYERYHPERFRCTVYETKDYQWFDGNPKAEDQRFIIGLKTGSMDRLPDVRPFLYYIGYFTCDRSTLPRSPSRHLSPVIEDLFVTAGREWLLAEWNQRTSGYFFTDRDWTLINRTRWPTMPYAACCLGYKFPMEDDFGFTRRHTDGDLGGDKFFDYNKPDRNVWHNVEGLLKTNVRVPLPQKSVIKVAPGHEDWDAFVRNLYGADHPVRLMMKLNLTIKSVQHNQVTFKDRPYVTREATTVHPYDPECRAQDKSISCLVQ